MGFHWTFPRNCTVGTSLGGTTRGILGKYPGLVLSVKLPKKFPMCYLGVSKRPEALFEPGSARWALAGPKPERPKPGPSLLKGGPGRGLHFRLGPVGWPESWVFSRGCNRAGRAGSCQQWTGPKQGRVKIGPIFSGQNFNSTARPKNRAGRTK